MALNKQDQQQIARMIASAVAKNDAERVDSIRRDFFVYTSEALALLATTNANDSIKIEADADFILQKLAWQADISAAAYTDSSRPWPNVSILITDSGSGRQLMDAPVPITSFMGSGELPFILPNPRRFERNGNIQIAYTNFDAAVDYNIRLAFIGYKIYKNA